MMMCEGILKIAPPSEQAFDPDFCMEAIIFLEREIKFLKVQRSKAQKVFDELFSGRMINPIKVMTVNDVENFIDKMTAKIDAAEMSICELNIRRQDYEIEKYSLHEMPDDVMIDEESRSPSQNSAGSTNLVIINAIVPSKFTHVTIHRGEKPLSDNSSVDDLSDSDILNELQVNKSSKSKAVGSEKMDKAKLGKPRVRKRSRTSTDSGYSSSACCSPDLHAPCTNPIAALLGGDLPYFSLDENALPKSLFGTYDKPELASSSKGILF